MDKSLVKQSAILTLGTGINAGLGLLFYLLLIRNLSVSNFGEFSFFLALGILMGELADLGVSSSVVKFGHADKFASVLTLGFYQRILAGYLILTVSLIANFLFQMNFLFSAAIAIAFLFFTLANQAFIAKEKYSHSVGLNIFANLFRLTVVVVLINLGLLSTQGGLWAFALSYCFAFLAGLIFVIVSLRFTPTPWSEAKSMIRTIMPFASWIGGSQAVAAVAAKIDSPMLFALTGPVQTGLYASAQKLASIISQFAGVLDSVFAPKLSKNDSSHHFRHFLILASVTAFFILLSIPFARWFVTLVFPPAYQASIPILEVLLFGYALFFLSTPFASSLVYRFGKSHFHLSGNVLSLILTVVLYLILLPKFGAMGAAYTFVIVNAVSLIFFASLYKKST